MGRNIWQSDNPVPMIRAVRAIIHGNANVSEAYELYKNFCESKPKSDAKPKSEN
jgi:putative autoinducer-2 (AI-2) aldolase